MIVIQFKGKDRYEIEGQMREWLGVDKEVGQAQPPLDFYTHNGPATIRSIDKAAESIIKPALESLATAVEKSADDAAVAAGSRKLRGRRGPKAKTIKIIEDIINETVDAIPFTAPPITHIEPASYIALPEVAKPVETSVPVVAGELAIAHTRESFKNNIVKTIAQLINDKKITQEYVQALNEWFGVNQIWEVFNKPEQVTALFDNFVKAGLITEVQQ